MKTNLLFRRKVTVDGVTTIELKIVPVDLDITSGEDWIYCGYADKFDLGNLNPPVEIKKEKPLLPPGSKFQSDVLGTAKLVKAKGKIFIASRKGKTVLNQTTPNSVCISDYVRQEFFNDCRNLFGYSPDEYGFSEKRNPSEYKYWSNWMDKEYMRQLDRFNKNIQ